MILKLSYGTVEIELYPEKAPNHVKRFIELADSGQYDGVVFHRVIEGFMAQSGDVKFGNSNNPDFNLSLAGTGGSNYAGSITIKTKDTMVIRKDPGNTIVAGAGNLKATPIAFHW